MFVFMWNLRIKLLVEEGGTIACFKKPKYWILYDYPSTICNGLPPSKEARDKIQRGQSTTNPYKMWLEKQTGTRMSGFMKDKPSD
jgi:hypothetical protein